MDEARYRLVVEGELGPRSSEAFEDMQVEAHEGTTVITRTIKDQAHLHGLLDRISSLGNTLVSVSPEDVDPAEPRAQRVDVAAEDGRENATIDGPKR